MQKILTIGAGRMAQAVISGILQQEEETFQVIVSNRDNLERLAQVKESYGVETTDNWKKHLTSSDILFLAIPPREQENLLKEVSPYITNQLVFSVAAGVGVKELENQLPDGTAVAWVMPNTAAEIGQSMTLYALGQHVKEMHKNTLETILRGIGPAQLVCEEQLHALTPITGSAPAFVYQVAEALGKVAMTKGIEEDVARKLVSQMILGSAQMLSSGQTPKDLMDQVATPGGSTAAGLKVLQVEGIEDMFEKAIEACLDKNKQVY
ncbi:pyrroline-5-carboxylate reductase [Radiobacillus kanasensis]|uniref:pyrroline-5-carboxylate reductase n=1 Tax=Radiobacillus kanasensis TaxID=2844358 RepID=UPI001E5ED20E|nr:pyrroline-5-carboxylate reductase [Radiobacillus kanasensis]UFT99718.1 pyrroline-5-carboxylate reductase [Radiobacillus kanasensis]